MEIHCSNPPANQLHITQQGNGIKLVILLFTAFFVISEARAQLNPFSSVYFQNQYLLNPAMAGIGGGLKLNLGLRQQWATLPGSPKTQVISADYSAGRNVGLGLNVSSDQAGLIRQTRALASYAYHIPLGSNDQQLNLGLSAGVTSQRVNYNEVQGDQGDEQIGLYNNQNRSYIDGDFGVSYTSQDLTLQAALPNLNHFLKYSNALLGVDRSVFMAAVSYRIRMENLLDGSVLEPKVVFRDVQGYKSIVDVGLSLAVKDDLLHLYSMYHSSQSQSFGFGANISKAVQLMLFYTTETAALKTYTNGEFEVGLKLNLQNNQH